MGENGCTLWKEIMGLGKGTVMMNMGGEGDEM